MITINFYFAAEEEILCVRKRQVSVIAQAAILTQAFCNTPSDFQMEKNELLCFMLHVLFIFLVMLVSKIAITSKLLFVV